MNFQNLTPDFNRITVSMQLPESHSEFIYKDWEDIISGKQSYDISNNASLNALLLSHSFETFQNDFFFLAFRFLKIKTAWNEIGKSFELSSGKQDQLLQALRFLEMHSSSDVKINFKHTIKNESASITNQLLIDIIKNALKVHFFENDIFIEQGFVNPEEINDLSTYLGFVSDEAKIENSNLQQKGRKRKYGQAGIMIDIMQTYLQKYTLLLAEPDISISRSQASFIYKFLNILEMVPDNLSWQEDNIRLILNKYRTIKSSKTPINVSASLKEYEVYEKAIIAKIKDINKNK
jgi:hypothetical protein